MVAGTFAATAALAPPASATPPTPTRVDLISSTVISPDTQSTVYQNDAEPGDAVQNVYYVTGACSPQAGKANCDPPNSAGQGVAGDSGTPVANATLSIAVDHGFFTPNCVSGAVTEYAGCSFTVPPVAGGQVGYLASLGTTETAMTDSAGEFVVTLGIGRDTNFDDDGIVTTAVSVGGLRSSSPGDRASGVQCGGGTELMPPLVSGTVSPLAPGGCEVENEWTTQEQPLNELFAGLIDLPPIVSTPGNVVPTENNVSATDGGTTSVPDIDRVDFVVHIEDQFENLTSNAGGPDLPVLTKLGPGSLYTCTGTSAVSACTGGALSGTSSPQPGGTTKQVVSAVTGSYLDPATQVRYQADTSQGTINLRYPCSVGESGCSAANTETPGANDGTQTNVLASTGSTTTFQTFIPGIAGPNVATYHAGNSNATDTYTLSFYDQFTAPVITFSITPDPTAGSVPVSTNETIQANVLDSSATPIVGQVVAFSRSGANASSCTAASSTSTDTSGVAKKVLTCTNAGTTSVTATITSNPGGTQLATKTWSVVFTTSVTGSPTAVVATPGNGQATVSWTAPTNTGGSTITGYDVEYSSNGGGSWTSASTAFHSSTATTQTVTGLTNGTSYTFRVAAINAVGTGTYSAASAAVTADGLPGAPSNVTATASGTQATVSWTAPANPGSSPITGYDVQFSSNGGGSWTPASSTFHTSTATTEIVTGLTGGTTYIFRVAAITAIGTGPYSTPSAAASPGAVPAAPTSVTAAAGDGKATVSWTAPTDTGASAVTGYAVQDSIDGGTTWASATSRTSADAPNAGTATTEVVTGLMNGTAYVFRVAAINAAGAGAFSAASAAVTPSGDLSAVSIGSDRTIDAGQHVTLTTRLTDTTASTPLGGALVQLFDRTGTNGAWAPLAAATTASNGTASITVSPKINTNYKWSFTGNATHGAASHSGLTITVRQVVIASLSKNHVAVGKKVHITGRVAPNESGETVSLQRRVSGEWVGTGKTATVGNASGYRFTIAQAKHGQYTFRVHRAATHHNAAGNSPTRHLTVS
jgi:hypothetical protein